MAKKKTKQSSEKSSEVIAQPSEPMDVSAEPTEQVAPQAPPGDKPGQPGAPTEVAVPVMCLQEQRKIGHFIVRNGKLTVEPVELIRSYRPETAMYRFARRPKNGAQLMCPRCNGELGVELKGKFHGGLILGEFEIKVG